jgi:hypothetical protein
VSSPFDDIVKRLEHLERRMARMEAMSGVGKAGNERATQPSALDPAPGQSTPSTAPPPTNSRLVPPSQSDPAAKGPPPTLRLAPIPPKDVSLDFPDLSLLDEKLDAPKATVEQLTVAAAIEEYPRICARIQQLWGTTECEPYLNTLVIDTRGNRKGFPPAMMEELLYLGRLARALIILNIGGDLWDAYDQIGDRR